MTTSINPAFLIEGATTPTINVSKIEANSQGIKITLGQKILNKVGNIAGAVTKEEASLKASLDAAKAKSPVFQTVSNNEKGGAITSILNKLSHTQPSNNNVNGINSVSNGLVNLAVIWAASTFIWLVIFVTVETIKKNRRGE